jgi:pyridoxal phosphate enzyme (YggS family)
MADDSIRSLIRRNLEAVEQRIRGACTRAGRSRADVTLIAVTKTVTSDVAGFLPELGVSDLAESRPQELARKAAVLPPTIRWHQIGHLQRNKIETTLPLAHLIHSVDSVGLLEALDEAATRRNQPVPVLLEINASQETNKHGFAVEEIAAVVPKLAALRAVRVQGLMTMAAFDEDPERCRPPFALLRGLRDQWRERLAPPHRLDHLSMGMSNDFEVAIEEGATLIRLGTVLFEGVTR